jgi:glycosyltransferase involved in cell wall biosynthesis
MRILLVDEVKIVNYAGGIERVMCNFANEFVKRGHTVTLACLDTEKGLPLYSLDTQVKFINMAFLGKPFINFSYYLKKGEKELLRTLGGSQMIFRGKKLPDPKKEYFNQQFISRLGKVIEITQPEIIVCVSTDSSYFAQEACGNKIPTVTMCHVEAKRMVENADAKEKLALTRSKAVQVLMPSYVNVVKNAGVRNVVYIPNIVEQIQQEECAALTDTKDYYTVITVGRVEINQKRTHLLVEAFSKLAPDFPNWQLKIYGEVDNGSYTKKIKKIIEDRQCAQRILLKGTTKQIGIELKKADLFAFPSAYEGFSLALTEAMSHGLPVIGYKNCSSVNELIQDGVNGYLCEDGLEDFTAKLKRLMQDQTLRVKMGQAAHNAMQAYAPEKIWDQWEELLKGICENK